MAKNEILHKAKASMEDECYILSNWKRLNDRLDVSNNICDKEFSGFYKGGAC